MDFSYSYAEGRLVIQVYGLRFTAGPDRFSLVGRGTISCCLHNGSRLTESKYAQATAVEGRSRSKSSEQRWDKGPYDVETRLEL